MSGPIVRKYGFPNFEQIFGKREPQHGVDEPDKPPVADEPGQTPPQAEQSPTPTAPEQTTNPQAT